ncbi:hypothetical protein BRC68_01975 [Halobacteriales archaeon QH_6_64_20]|nr:MAG: hypothetical protein BRC68_01975 [Halobacteriales archaeon QH_6_64_20]
MTKGATRLSDHAPRLTHFARSPTVLTSSGFYERLALLVFRALVHSLRSLTRTPSDRPLPVPPKAVSIDLRRSTEHRRVKRGRETSARKKAALTGDS